LKMKSKKSWKQIISVGLAASVIASVGMLPVARGELVYEPEVSPAAPPAVRADDRDQMRTALQSSEKAKATVQSVQAAPAQQVQQVQMVQPVQPVQQVQAAPVQQLYSVTTPAQVIAAPVAAPQAVSATDAPQVDVQSLSKAELMRRERTRTELQNEDLLQERLEELRLRDEKRRTDQLLGQEPGAQQAGEANMSVAAPTAPTTQGVAAPITDHPGQYVAAPVPTQVQATNQGPEAAAYGNYTPGAQAQIAGGQSVTTMSASDLDKDDHVKFSMSPHAGVSIMNTNSAFDVTGKVAAGFTLGMGISDNVTFELGYTYAQYGIGLGDSSSYGSYGYAGNTDTYQLNQNVFEAGLKLDLLGPDSKFRPFVGGGGGYAKSYLNFPSSVTQYYQTAGYNNPDFDSSDFLGYVEAGFDAKISKQISVGMVAKYYKVLSDDENQNLNYGNFYSGSYGGGMNPTQAIAGTQLAQSSFYSLLADVSFAF
jgi:outer membrane protein W